MEDVMFFHKTRLLATVFALTTTALTIGTASANGERQNLDNYCDEGDNCTAQYAGIVQTERDGVNYFYGSSDKTFGYTSYRVLRIDYTDHTPPVAPDEFMQPDEIIQYVPYGHSFRPWHHKLKRGHKKNMLGFIPEHSGKSQFRHRNKVHYPAAP
jgi:hypothetical protein